MAHTVFFIFQFQLLCLFLIWMCMQWIKICVKMEFSVQFKHVNIYRDDCYWQTTGNRASHIKCLDLMRNAFFTEFQYLGENWMLTWYMFLSGPAHIPYGVIWHALSLNIMFSISSYSCLIIVLLLITHSTIADFMLAQVSSFSQ